MRMGEQAGVNGQRGRGMRYRMGVVFCPPVLGFDALGRCGLKEGASVMKGGVFVWACPRGLRVRVLRRGHVQG
jgi:hypothetical protein